MYHNQGNCQGLWIKWLSLKPCWEAGSQKGDYAFNIQCLFLRTRLIFTLEMSFLWRP